MDPYTLNLRAMSPYSNETLESAKESMEYYFQRCAEIQQGISTKEVVRYRCICEEMKRRGLATYQVL